MQETVVGVGKQKQVGRFARFRQHGSKERLRPGYVVGFEHLDLGDCSKTGDRRSGCRVTVHALDTRETLHDGEFELLPASPEEFAGKLKHFFVRHTGLGLCQTIGEELVNGKPHLMLVSRRHGRISGLVPVSELEFLGPVP